MSMPSVPSNISSGCTAVLCAYPPYELLHHPSFPDVLAMQIRCRRLGWPTLKSRSSARALYASTDKPWDLQPYRLQAGPDAVVLRMDSAAAAHRLARKKDPSHKAPSSTPLLRRFNT